MAAAVKAHVYRLPQTTIAAIKAALSSLPSTTSVFIACANGLEEMCGQLTSAARSVGIDPTVREGQAFLSAGFDADPLARTPNPNITIAFMARYASAAHAIDRASGSRPTHRARRVPAKYDQANRDSSKSSMFSASFSLSRHCGSQCDRRRFRCGQRYRAVVRVRSAANRRAIFLPLSARHLYRWWLPLTAKRCFFRPVEPHH